MVYLGPPVLSLPPSTATDQDGTANSIVEGAAVDTLVGITAASTSQFGLPITYALAADSSNGGFKIDPVTGVVTVADPGKIDFETASGHAYTITVNSSDGFGTSSQTFTINVADVAPTTPVDANGAANFVAEGAAANTQVGITAVSSDVNGPGVTWSLSNNANGAFKIDAVTGVVSVADPTKIDFESTAPGHTLNITAVASDGTLSSAQNFTINVTDVALTAPVDSDATANSVPEGAGSGSTVGVTVFAVDPNGPATSYLLTGDTSGGGFAVDASTGVVTIADASKINFETSGGSYTVTVQATAGAQTTSQIFTIAVTDVAPATPVDTNVATNAVFEGAANGTAVGITAASIDPNGPAVTFSLTDNAGGRFAIDPNSGVVTVANGAAIDFETATGHAYGITVQAHAGALNTTTNFSIAVNNVNEAPQGANNTVTTLEDAAYTFTAADFGFTDTSDNPANALQAVKITTLPGGGTLTNNGNPVVAGNFISAADIVAGHLIFAPTANANGAPQGSFTFQVQDDGGTANGGVDTDQSPNTITINVIAVNDVPSFTVGATQNVLEDSGAHTVNGFATGISAGPANEAGQTVNFIASNNNNALFSAQPTIDAGGNLSYTSAANANGTATVTVQIHDNGGTANGGIDTSAAQTFTINVGPVNDAPQGADNTVTTNEDISYTFTAADFGFTDTSDNPANALQAVKITTVPGGAAGTLFDNGVAVAAGAFVTAAHINSGLLVFTPAANANGTPEASFTFQVQDDGGTANGGVDLDQSPNTITVNVTPVNDAPAGTDGIVSAQGAHVFVAADFGFTDPIDAASAAGANTLLAVEITTIPASGLLTLNSVAVTAGQFVTVTDINSGLLVFTPSGNTAGSFTFQVQDNGGTANGGVDLDQSPNTLTVIQNTAPVANDDSVSATEAGGLNNAVAGVDPAGNVILGTGSAGSVQDTDAEDPSNALTVVAVHTGPEGGSILAGTVGSPLTGAHGTLTLGSNGAYTYQVSQSDAQVQALHSAAETITDQFNYTIRDTGGLQDTASLTITIHGADDLPQAVADTGTMFEDDAPTSFNVIANDTQDPDHTATNAITVGPGGITVTGPAGETFVNSDATASIVANQIQVSLVNSHFQQLALGEHATVTVPYTLTGDAGETSSANLVVTVNGVNDVPVAVDDTSAAITEDQVGTFTVLSNDMLDADHGAPNNVTTGAISNLVAPSGESIDTSDIGLSVNGSNQVVATLGSDFQHMKDGETATFDVAYTLHGDQPGDTSTATLHVTVNGANDAPTASNFTFNGANSAIGNTDLVVNDPADGAPDPAGPQKTISGSLLSGASDVDGPGPLVVVAGTIATANGGTVTMQADGDFTYKPAVGFTGSDSFTYSVSDLNPGVAGIGTGTVTINVATPKVWYVNADAASDGDGSSENPFNTLSHFAGAGGVDAAGDTIVLETATAHYTGGLTLENNEQLLSQSAGVTINGTTLFAASGANAVLDGGLVLASGNNVQGVDFGTNAGNFAVSGSSVGTLHLDDATTGVINNASGGGIGIGGTANVLNVDFNSITTGGGTNGITLANTSGTFHSHGGTISNAAGADVALSGGTLNFTQDGAISDATGGAVLIAGMTGGTQDFNGAITGAGITLSSNTGATMSFDGGMTLTSGAANAFSATGGGTLTVTGTNHLTSTTGTALNISNTTIGSGNVTFQDISSNGGSADGIILDTTGSLGGLHVTGVGTTAGSGGTIANKTGADLDRAAGIGIYLNNTKDVQLTDMILHDFQNFGIRGFDVNGFTLDHSTVNGTNGTNPANNGADDAGEGSIYFGNTTTNGLTGAVAITNDAISGGRARNFSDTTTSGTAHLNYQNDTFGLTQNFTDANQSLLVEARGTGTTVNSIVNNSTFAGAPGGQVNFSGQQNTIMNVNFTNNTLTDTISSNIVGGGNLTLATAGSMVFSVDSNTFSGADGSAITLQMAAPLAGVTDARSLSGTLNNNTIGISGTVDSGSKSGNGIFMSFADNATAPKGLATIALTNNIIQQIEGNAGIFDDNTGGGYDVNLTVTGNTVRQPGAGTFANIAVTNGANTSSDDINVFAKISGNDFSDSAAGTAADIIVGSSGLGNSTTHTFTLSGATAADVVDETAIENFLKNSNNLNGASATTTVLAYADAPATLAAFKASAGAPPLPGAPAPLFAAVGGVQASSPTPGETHLTQTELDTIAAAAISQWAAAGASASQLAALQATTFSVADLSGHVVGQESSPAHITIDTSADGHGWFVDSTPFDNLEFAHAVNLGGTDLYTDPTSAAAGHLDLLTTVSHELGHVLGLADTTDAITANDLMYIDLVDGERRIPDATDVVQATTPAWTPAAPAAPAAAQGPLTFAYGNPGNDTIDAGKGGIIFGGAGADTFVFANADVKTATPPPIAQVMDYHFAEGDKFDFSALTSQFHSTGIDDNLIVRAVEDASGTFAKLQVDIIDPRGMPGMPIWVDVAQIAGAHSGDALDVLVDSHSAVHLAQIHVDVLV